MGELDTILTQEELDALAEIRARLIATRFRFTSFDFAGQKIRLADWTMFRVADLKPSERAEVVLLSTKRWYEFQGRHDEEEVWIPLSSWRREELRRAPTVVVPDTPGATTAVEETAQRATSIDDIVDEMREAIANMDREPSAGDTAWKLKRRGLLIPDIIEVLRRLGFQKVNAGNIHEHLRYGKSVEKKRGAQS